MMNAQIANRYLRDFGFDPESPQGFARIFGGRYETLTGKSELVADTLVSLMIGANHLELDYETGQIIGNPTGFTDGREKLWCIDYDGTGIVGVPVDMRASRRQPGGGLGLGDAGIVPTYGDLPTTVSDTAGTIIKTSGGSTYGDADLWVTEGPFNGRSDLVYSLTLESDTGLTFGFAGTPDVLDERYSLVVAAGSAQAHYEGDPVGTLGTVQPGSTLSLRLVSGQIEYRVDGQLLHTQPASGGTLYPFVRLATVGAGFRDAGIVSHSVNADSLQGRPIDPIAPGYEQVLRWNDEQGAWAPADLPEVLFERAGTLVRPIDGHATDDFVFGATGLTVTTSPMILFHKGKGAFRVGSASGAQWSLNNIGTYSVALGQDVMAKGSYSVGLGRNLRVESSYGVALGYAIGSDTSDSITIGTNIQARPRTNGQGMAIDYDKPSIGIGHQLQVSSTNVAVGTQVRIGTTSTRNLALGRDVGNIGWDPFAGDIEACTLNDSVLIGAAVTIPYTQGQKPGIEQVVGVGKDVQLSNTSQVLIGNQLKATNKTDALQAVAVGNNLDPCLVPGQVALGNGSYTNHSYRSQGSEIRLFCVLPYYTSFMPNHLGYMRGTPYTAAPPYPGSAQSPAVTGITINPGSTVSLVGTVTVNQDVTDHVRVWEIKVVVHRKKTGALAFVGTPVLTVIAGTTTTLTLAVNLVDGKLTFSCADTANSTNKSTWLLSARMAEVYM